MAVRAKNRGLIYLRRSSGKQELSLESQLTWAVETAAQEGVLIDASLADLKHMQRIGLSSYKDIRLDDSISGADMSRPGFVAVQDDIFRDRRVSHLFIYMRDRFSRPQDALPMAMIEKSIRERGVTMVMVNGTALPLSQGNSDLGEDLKIIVEYYMSGDFLRKLAERIVNAGKSIAARGYWNGGQAPYGFIRVFVNDAGEVLQELPPGRTIRQEGCHVQLRLEESDKIRWLILMLDLSRAGWGARRIANLLNDFGVPSPDAGKVRKVRGVLRRNNGKWNPRTVLDLLRNPAIIGELRYGRRSMGAHRRIGANGPRPLEDGDRTEKGSLRVIQNDPSLQVRRSGGYEAGYDKSAWQEVQQKLDERGRIQTGIPRVSDLGKYPLSCRVIDMTDSCGGILYARSHGQRRIYVCGRYVKYGATACNNNAVDAEALLTFVIEFFRKFSGPDLEQRLRELWAARQNEVQSENLVLRNREADALADEIERLKLEKNTLLQNMSRISNEALIKELETKFTEITRALADAEQRFGSLLPVEATPVLSPEEEIQSALELLRNFGAVLDDPQARDTLSGLFEKIGLRIGLRFKEGRKGKRKVRVLHGGVMTLGGGKLPIDLHGRDRVEVDADSAGVAIATPKAAVLTAAGDIVTADGQVLMLQGREQHEDKKEAEGEESPSADQSRVNVRPNEGVSSTMLSRGDRTPVELFLAGLADWSAAAINGAAGVQK